jgi:hypothetical protein
VMEAAQAVTAVLEVIVEAATGALVEAINV